MSDDLNWDDVLGGVEKDEAENPDTGDSFDAIPKGPYNIVVQEADKQTSKTGKDMIKLRVQVTDGPSANRVLFNYIVFSTDNPTAMRLTLQRLAAFGITREFIAANRPAVGQIAELLVGRKAVAVVGIQEKGEYKGTNEIKSFRPLDGEAQAAPAAPKPAGVPSIPQAAPSAPAPAAPAAPAPAVPTPDVPVGTPDGDPFG